MKQDKRNFLSEYLAIIGSKGGKAGSKADKVKAAKARWANKTDKPK